MEMARTFNCGVGAVLIVDKSLAASVVEQLETAEHIAAKIGHVVPTKGNLLTPV